PQEDFQFTLLAYASEGDLSSGFSQCQYYGFYHGLAQALSSHCTHPAHHGPAGGPLPSRALYSQVPHGDSTTCIEGTNKQHSW
ncbi:mCG144927, partial [Mus musculus]